MRGLSESELLFYAGIAVMCLTAAAALACVAVFKISKRKINKTLEKEYGSWPR